MKNFLALLLFLLFEGSNSFCQVKLYEDQFNGGVTGGSFSSGVSGAGSGVITVHIDSTSTIRKAYLLVGRLGPTAAMTVNLNSMVLTFDASTQATPDFQCALYGGLSAVHAIDITSQINPAESTYNISYAQGGSGANFYTDFYLYVAYENSALPLVNTVIFLKTTDYIVTELYTLNVVNPIDTLVPVAFAMHAGYMCNPSADGEDIWVESTLLGTIGGGDPNNPVNVCAGTSGTFYYENNTLFALNGDNPNQAMLASDALSDIKLTIPNNTTTFDVTFEHFGGAGSSADNSMWAWVLAYGNSNVQPTAVFSSPNDICPGTCTDFTNLSVNATSFIWNFPGANPASSTDVNPTGICYNTPGQYNVELIATNANGSDTLVLANYITVFPFSPPQGILQNGDTLTANSGAVSYQWYYNGNLISGATNSFYLASLSGNYNVVATDLNGCETEAGIFDVIAGLSPLSEGEGMEVWAYPNPVTGSLFVNRYPLFETAISLSVFNLLGEEIQLPVDSATMSVDCSLLIPGIYFLCLKNQNRTYHIKFVKSN